MMKSNKRRLIDSVIITSLIIVESFKDRFAMVDDNYNDNDTCKR